MSFNERAKTVALAIVHVFETGKPLGDYSAVAVLTDGAGFSVGINQFTHRSGSLWAVLDRFKQLGGTLRDNLDEALPDFRAGRNVAKRSADAGLKSALKALGSHALWRQAQREIASEKYLKPAIDACEGSGFQWPLSLAVVYDSINQGSYPKVRDRVSADSSNEKAWIAEYCADRKAFLKSSAKSIVRGTVYRPNFFLGQIANANWSLNLPIVVNGYKLTDAILFPTNSVTTPTDSTPPAIPAVQDSSENSPIPPNGSSPSIQAVEPPPVVQPQDEVTKTQVTTTEGDTKETVQVTTKNEQDVNEPAQVGSSKLYKDVGFIGALKKDFGAVGGGNLSFQMLQGYAQDASGWPPWVISLITKLATIVLVLGAAWLLFRLTHYLVWKIGDLWRQKIEADINSDVKRKNVEFT